MLLYKVMELIQQHVDAILYPFNAGALSYAEDTIESALESPSEQHTSAAKATNESSTVTAAALESIEKEVTTAQLWLHSVRSGSTSNGATHKSKSAAATVDATQDVVQQAKQKAQSIAALCDQLRQQQQQQQQQAEQQQNTAKQQQATEPEPAP